jgi:hypothetical protein
VDHHLSTAHPISGLIRSWSLIVSDSLKVASWRYTLPVRHHGRLMTIRI